MNTTIAANSKVLSDYIATTMDRQLPPEILDAARMCLADWLAVGIGAHDQGAGIAARNVAKSWNTTGKAPVFFGGRQAPIASAFVNGTFAHCLDYDDTHLGSLAHISGPTWAAALAVAIAEGAGDQQALKAFVTGFETIARIGGKDLGTTANKNGFHSTSIFGRFSAAAAAGALMELNEGQIANALGVAATTAGGLVASFGSMSKPFHAGKASMDGVLAAQLAANGFEAGKELLEPSADGLARALVPDLKVDIQPIRFDDGWEILNNTFKPYAACLLVHPLIESGRAMSDLIKDRQISTIKSRINPMVMRFAAKADPKEPLEGKFSVAYCAALGLCGFDASEQDFSTERLANRQVRDVMQKIELVPDETVASTAASMSITFADGEEISAETPLASGNPGNPIGWDGMHRKFMSLVEPVLGSKSAKLFDLAKELGNGNSLEEIASMVSEVTHH